MKRKISIILVLVLLMSTLLPSMAFAVPYKNLNMDQYMLKSFHSRIYNGLPWGLFKRGEGNLPPGLAKKLELPHGLSKEFHADNFVLYVNKMLIKYNRTETEGLIDEIKVLLDVDPIDKDAIELLLEELKETYLWYQFIDKVELIIVKCEEVDTSLAAQIEAYILLDDPEDREVIEALVEELEALCDTFEYYEDLVDGINAILDADGFAWGDTETGVSFLIKFNLWNGLVVPNPDPIVLAEAIVVLEALLDYLDDMFTITEGIAALNVYKIQMEVILEAPEFTTGANYGVYIIGVEDMFDEYIAEIDDLTNPELFDIIVLISKVELLLDTYEDMRYVTLLENVDYIAKRDAVLALTATIVGLDNDELDILYAEFVVLVAQLNAEAYIELAQYDNFIEKYDDLMELYVILTTP